MNRSLKILVILVITGAVFALGFTFGFLASDSSQKHAQSNLASSSPSPTQTPSPVNGDKLFSLIQAWRTSVDLPQFQKDKYTCEVAQARLPEIKTNWSHDGWYKYQKSYPNAKGDYLGENLALSEGNDQQTLTAWINSPEHLKNLIKPYKYSCIATDGTYTVQEFATY